MKMIKSEDSECIALIDWAKYHSICSKYLIHIANGGSRHLLEARKLKRMGVKAGVSDYFLAYPTSKFHGLWVEMKSKKGIISPSQKEWIVLMLEQGYDAIVCRSFEQAVKYITNYIYED